MHLLYLSNQIDLIFSDNVVYQFCFIKVPYVITRIIQSLTYITLGYIPRATYVIARSTLEWIAGF